VYGAGALGANITKNLARSGAGSLVVIDRDRIEERNLSTQPYYKSDVGAYKAKILNYKFIQVQGGKTFNVQPDNIQFFKTFILQQKAMSLLARLLY
jgi:tRNA A37 threonylcarbamoyladenosine dehydratase